MSHGKGARRIIVDKCVRVKPKSHSGVELGRALVALAVASHVSEVLSLGSAGDPERCNKNAICECGRKYQLGMELNI